MGSFTNGPVANIVAGATTVVLIALSAALIAGTIAG
jgi:hypothetical protein